MRPTVIAMGGSVVAPGQADPGFIRGLASLLDRESQDRPLLIVVGGGKTARSAIALARDEGGEESMLDRIGIQGTRLNAQILIAFLAARGVPVNDDVPLDAATASGLLETHRVVVMGGTTPGHSTDYVGAELARAASADRLVIATNVDGVYDKDPRAHADAQRIPVLDFEGLASIVGTLEWQSAGQAGVVDGPATALLKASRIETRVVHGGDLENLAAALRGEAFNGTLVRDT